MDFTTRYNMLNSAQQQAVDTIDGPVMVIAGPGTGKTELLSMRVANILRQTDTLPQNILCLTFTDSGASAMRERLVSIVGRDAYKVAIHTFHSFGSEVINQNSEFFYHGAEFRPADELNQLEILHKIFDEMEYNNVLASKMNGEYTFLSDVAKSISHIKKSGLTGEEMLSILAANDLVMDAVEKDLGEIFSTRITKATIPQLPAILARVLAVDEPQQVATVTSFASVLSESLSHALGESENDNGNTKPVTAWRSKWMEKDVNGTLVFKSRKRQAKLRALASVYQQYLQRMQEAGLYDFDDMILSVIHTMEAHPDLRFNLQEKYQYLLIDEFQDTNMAQMRILFDLTDNPVNEGRPNIMVVGDDDQAIYSFQGADVGNIINFQNMYPTLARITLVDNYRSAPCVLQQARQVIVQGSDRLESHMADLNKELVPHKPGTDSLVEIAEHQTVGDEYTWVATSIAAKIATGVAPSSIVILARKHAQLETLLPYLAEKEVLVNYEHRDNILELDIITHIELICQIIVAVHEQQLDDANDLLPELISHPAWGFSTEDIWALSLSAYKNKQLWLETMSITPTFVPLHSWLISMAARIPHTPLELMLDMIIDGQQPDEEELFSSPLRSYYFSDTVLQDNPEVYLQFLDALRTIRTKLREYCQDNTPRLQVFLEYIDLHQQFNRSITSSRPASETIDNAVYLMSAHKSKGLEFDHVYIINSYEKNWGKSAGSMNSKITYPENLPLMPSTGTADERLRLFYVAMTRAKKQLHISYSELDHTGKNALRANFLLSETLAVHKISSPQSIENLIRIAEIDWRTPLYTVPPSTMKLLLAPVLEKYRLSSTHINAFIDVASGGPHSFLLNNLLHFPSSKSPAASYGTAVHNTLQRAHAHLTATGELRPVEDILHDFENALSEQQLSDEDFQTYLQKGSDTLAAFLEQRYATFTKTQKTELNFSSQQAIYDDVHLTGTLDLVDIDQEAQTILVTDYKTGKPSRSWKGGPDYEKIKLHKYRQQLMFYRLLIESSRDYAKYSFKGGVLQFVEPTPNGEITQLETEFTEAEYDTFKRLVKAIWAKILALDLPDTSTYTPDFDGLLAFEQSLLDETA